MTGGGAVRFGGKDWMRCGQSGAWRSRGVTGFFVASPGADVEERLDGFLERAGVEAAHATELGAFVGHVGAVEREPHRGRQFGLEGQPELYL